MNALAPYLETFLREYPPRDRRLSTHTIETYAYAFQLWCALPPNDCA
jgi:hypothetical protein